MVKYLRVPLALLFPSPPPFLFPFAILEPKEPWILLSVTAHRLGYLWILLEAMMSSCRLHFLLGRIVQVIGLSVLSQAHVYLVSAQLVSI